MKKTVKKLFALAMAVTVAATSGFMQSPVTAQAATTSWNFKNNSFKNLGTITSTTTVENLTLVATSSKSMAVKAEKRQVDGVEYTHALALSGSGSTQYRSVKVPVSGNDTIKVVCRSSGNTTRNLAVVQENGQKVSSIPAYSNASLQTYKYSGSAGSIYLYSENGGINIYKIQVDSNGTTGGNNSGNTGNTGGNNSGNTGVSSYEYIADGWYYIKNTNSQKYLQISGDYGYDGVNVEQGTGNGATKQKWYLTNKGNGYFTLKNGTGYMLDIPYGTNQDGTNVQLWSENGMDPQLFKAVRSKSGAYGILTKASFDTKCLDVYAFNKNDGGNINQWTYYDNTCQQWIFESTSASSGSQTPSDGTVVTNFNELVNAISKAEKAGGGKIYVQGNKIDCTKQLTLSASNSNVEIIGVKNGDGSYPRLDFTSFRNQYIGKATNDSAVGVRITGSKYTLKDLIIEKAPDNGIQIKGSSAGNNTINNCIVRYNNDAGVQITGGAYNNTIRFVYSYRNCDVYTLGGNADGFAPKLGAGRGNTFYGCYAWDNADDGWDSYDKDSLTYDLSYTECACWNNGNPEVFTGQYDYKNGKALDKNLLLVELMCNRDSNFASSYANGSYYMPSGNFIATKEGTVSVSDWAGSKFAGNPNGFKFGSVNTTSSCVRTVKHCLSFGHGKKGFDNNNSSCTASFDGCISYDNGYNYYMPPFTMQQFNNCLGFSGKSSDKLPGGVSVTKPDNNRQSSIRNTVNNTVNDIVTKCQNNQIPGEVYFNIY